MSLILKSLFLPREKMADSDSDYASDHSDAKERVSKELFFDSFGKTGF